MEHARLRKPARAQFEHAHPGHALLTASAQGVPSQTGGGVESDQKQRQSDRNPHWPEALCR